MTVEIDWHTGPRAELQPLFELAEDSQEQLHDYRELGRVLVARALVASALVRSAGEGYPDAIVIDGIPLRDRVWLSQNL